MSNISWDIYTQVNDDQRFYSEPHLNTEAVDVAHPVVASSLQEADAFDRKDV